MLITLVFLPVITALITYLYLSDQPHQAWAALLETAPNLGDPYRTSADPRAATRRTRGPGRPPPRVVAMAAATSFGLAGGLAAVSVALMTLGVIATTHDALSPAVAFDPLAILACAAGGAGAWVSRRQWRIGCYLLSRRAAKLADVHTEAAVTILVAMLALGAVAWGWVSLAVERPIVFVDAVHFSALAALPAFAVVHGQLLVAAANVVSLRTLLED